jgi:hypothetical protein
MGPRPWGVPGAVRHMLVIMYATEDHPRGRAFLRAFVESLKQLGWAAVAICAWMLAEANGREA